MEIMREWYDILLESRVDLMTILRYYANHGCDVWVMKDLLNFYCGKYDLMGKEEENE